MSKVEILVGADPELFMTREGQFVSAHGAIQGDKKNPFKVNRGAVQVDGMALEFNIDPAKNEEEFILNLNTVMGVLQEMVPDCKLNAVPVANFSQQVMDAQPLEALELGCEPDFNAWENGAVNPRPNGKVNFRTGAGHVHIGWGNGFDINDPEHLEACCMVAKQLDYYLGLGSLFFDKEGGKRRVMYGAPGCFRPKPYGVEYRVLSNAWLKDEGLMRWVYRNTIAGVQALMSGIRAYDDYDSLVQTTLKAEKPRLDWAKQICAAKNIQLPPAVKV